METIYILPLKILAVVVTLTVIGIVIAWYRKRKKRKKNLRIVHTKENADIPPLNYRSGFEDGVIN